MKSFNRNFVLAGVLSLLVLAAFGYRQNSALQNIQARLSGQVADMSGQVFKERVVDLPEDAGAWYTTLVYRDQAADPASRKLASMMAATLQLQSLVAQTKTFVYTPDDPLYKTRYSKTFGGQLPAIQLQDAAGNVVYKASGENIPSDGRKLADEIARQISRHVERCPDCRPRPKPTPTPKPTPVTPAVVPDLRPSEETPPEENSFPLLAVLLPFLAGAAGLMQEWKKSIA